MINTFESEYPFGNLLEDSKFDELSEYLQFHFQKKNAVNALDEGNISMHALIFCCRWEIKSLHTIFSYIITSLSNVMRCRNNLAQWFFKFSNEIYGCVPPTLEVILKNLIWSFLLSNICLTTKQQSRTTKLLSGFFMLLF